jgi:hypothetical protein
MSRLDNGGGKFEIAAGTCLVRTKDNQLIGLKEIKNKPYLLDAQTELAPTKPNWHRQPSGEWTDIPDLRHEGEQSGTMPPKSSNRKLLRLQPQDRMNKK